MRADQRAIDPLMQGAFPPLLVVAGFPRTGTTSMYKNFEAHPGFAAPVRKELNFFSKAVQPPLAEYERNFRGRETGQVCVDISPMYSLEPGTYARLRQAVPHARVVLLVREPAVWIHSLYTQMRSYTLKPPSFRQFLDDGLFLMPNRAESVRLPIKQGLFRRTLDAFAGEFGDRLLVIDFAAFEKSPLDVLKRVEAFVGAAAFFTAKTVDGRAHNSSALALRHPAFVRFFLSQEALIATAAKLLPAPILRRVRGLVYYAGKGETVNSTASIDKDDLALATAATQADRAVYDELFRISSFHLGADLQLNGI